MHVYLQFNALSSAVKRIITSLNTHAAAARNMSMSNIRLFFAVESGDRTLVSENEHPLSRKVAIFKL